MVRYMWLINGPSGSNGLCASHLINNLVGGCFSAEAAGFAFLPWTVCAAVVSDLSMCRVYEPTSVNERVLVSRRADARAGANHSTDGNRLSTSWRTHLENTE